MTENSTTPIDTATVERCIKLLRGHGEYKRQWGRQPYRSDPELVETWTFTTHPMDLLRGLIVTKTEAEKLVSEWREYRDPEDDYGLFGRDDMNTLAQFILDKQQPATHPSVTAFREAFDRTGTMVGTLAEPEPRYVFGPWIEWHGGECPVPGDWMVDVRFRDLGAYSQPIPAGKLHWGHYKNDLRDITHYRVRFEVGKWYDWIGGPRPVGDDVQLGWQALNGWAGGNTTPSDIHWDYITKFQIIRVVGDAA